MAVQRVSNERKKELEGLDPFQENLLKAADIAKEYKKPLLLGLAALMIAAGAFWATMASFQSARENASALLENASIAYGKAKDPKAGYDAVKEDFQKIFDEYANTAAGKVARIRFASIAYAAGQHDIAYDMYIKAYEKFKNDPHLKELLLLSLGNVCVARNDYDKGLEFFDDAREYGGGIWKDQAVFMTAQVHELKNDINASRELYEQLSVKQPPSMYQEMAKDRVVHLSE